MLDVMIKFSEIRARNVCVCARLMDFFYNSIITLRSNSKNRMAIFIYIEYIDILAVVHRRVAKATQTTLIATVKFAQPNQKLSDDRFKERFSDPSS